jgi:anti-sigma B factor antagonist
MEIRQRLTGHLAVLEVGGRFTVADRPGQLKEAASAAIRGGARFVFLDLSGVKYIDSTELGELISTHIAVTKQGGRLKLVSPPERISTLLRLAGLADIFEQFESLALAEASLE